MAAAPSVHPRAMDNRNYFERKKTFFDILSLCLRSKCPVCSHGHLFAPLLRINSIPSFFYPRKKCDHCGFKFNREPGYYFGVIMPTLPILSLGVGLIFFGVSYFPLRSEIREALWAGVLGVFIGLVSFFRTAVAIYMSIDHALDPPSPRHPDRERSLAADHQGVQVPSICAQVNEAAPASKRGL